MKILIVVMLFLYGVTLIIDWKENLPTCKVGDSLEEIQDYYVGDYVSFYIDEYFYKEIYVEDNIEYEIYTILEERDTESNVNSYIQVMVRNEDTKEKLKNIRDGKVYIQGIVLDDTNGEFKFGKEWGTFVPVGMEEYQNTLCRNWVIKEEAIPSKGYGIYVGIALMIVSVILYKAFGGVKALIPDVEIKDDKYKEYEHVHAMKLYNIHNDLECEKDNLKRLIQEQTENKKTDNIMTTIFIIGLILLCWGSVSGFLHSIILGSIVERSILMVMLIVLKLIGLILVLVSAGGVWSKFINSSHKLAVYIAVKKHKRSIYVEIVKCKKNILQLERIIEEMNLVEMNIR
jgi:hypothetical protein